ncbi:MAG: hypothetical protein AB7P17_11275 [Nitrospirales bacterium]|nr:hypothetical protein [Nitrospirales bacterium]
MQIPLVNRFLSVILTCALFCPGLSALASIPDETTTITLEQEVHFLGPDGSDVVAAPGEYSVEQAEEWLRLIPGTERRNALLVEAQKGTHEVKVEVPIVLSIPGSEPDELDVHVVQFLNPDGTSMIANGTYSGIQSRGLFDAAKRAAAAARARAEAARRAAAAKSKQAADAARAAALKAKQAAEQAAKAAAAKAQELAKQAAQFAKVQACKIQVSAIKGGIKVGEAAESVMQKVTAILPVAKQRQGSLQNRLNQDPAYRAQIVNTMLTTINANQYVLPELQRIQANLNNPAKRSQFMELLFSPAMICENSIADLDKALIQAGLAPSFATIRTRGATDNHFYMGFQVTLDAAYVGGAQVGFFGVTDFRGNGGWHWFIGPEAGVVVGGGGSLEAIFFPKVNLDSFAGWGSGIGGSAGAGATVNVDGMWDGSVKEFQGFGIGGGGGVGSKMVGSLAVSYTHAWKIGN